MKINKKRSVSSIMMLTLLALLFNAPIKAQSDTISLTDPKFDLSHLPLGHSEYLVYLVDTVAGSAPYGLSTWDRKVARSDKKIKVDWQMNEGDSAKFIKKEIIIDAQSFKPETESILYTAAVTGVKDFRFFYHFGDNMLFTSKDTMLHNYTEIKMPYDYLAYLWEVDLEIFSMLTYQLGKTYVIPFYHPGGAPPAYYSYKVNRKEMLNIGGRDIAAWVLVHEDQANKATSEWWVDCESQQVLKMRSRSGSTYRYKYLLSYKSDMPPKSTP